MTEDPEHDAVVAIGLDVVVGLVNPADDVLGRIAIIERGSETTDVLGHSRTVPEELQMPVIAVLGL